MKHDIRHNNKPTDSDILVSFLVEDDIYTDEFNTEILWCEKVIKKRNTAIVRNIPFLIYGINPGDEIEYTKSDDVNLFKKLIKDGGQYTYRIALKNDENHTKHTTNKNRVTSELNKLSISFEQMNIMLLAACASNAKEAILLENMLIALQNQGLIQGYDTSK